MRFKKIFLVVIGALLLQSACHSLKFDNVQEIASVYDSHEAAFQEAADLLITYRDDELVLISASDSGAMANLCVQKFDDIMIATTKPLSQAEYQALAQVVTPLFEDAHVVTISRRRSWVAFNLESHDGRTADLYYEVEGNAIVTGFSITDCLQIKDCWYAITTSD